MQEDTLHSEKILNLDKQAKEIGLNRMLLHATSISFKNLEISCSAELPKLFSKIMS